MVEGEGRKERERERERERIYRESLQKKRYILENTNIKCISGLHTKLMKVLRILKCSLLILLRLTKYYKYYTLLVYMHM